MTAKKSKAEKKSTAKVPMGKKTKASDLPNRELVEVTAIVLKKGKLAVTDRQVVYETAGAYCVWDKDQRKRIHWIPRKRVLDIER
jgi:hypothetical protein